MTRVVRSNHRRALLLLMLISTFVLPFVGAVFAGFAMSPGGRLDTQDVLFCTLTLTNCMPYNPFNDPPVWGNVLILNATIFAIWQTYAWAAYICVAGRNPGARVLGTLLALTIPSGMALFGLLIIVLQGIRL